MKTVLQPLIFLAIFSGIAFSQITIVESDFNFHYEFGHKITSYGNNSTSFIHIGDAGASSWDFSNLNADNFYDCDIKSPTNTPFKPDYPSAQMAFEYDYNINEVSERNWEFYCHSSFYLHLHGLVFTNESDTSRVNIIYYNPLKIFAAFPMNYQSTWKDSVIETSKIKENGTEISRVYNSIVTNASVDAYGPITFPDGKTLDALRVRVTQTRSDENSTETRLFFQWFTKTGETFVIETDPESADNGLISSTGAKWRLNSVPTDVVQVNSAPVKFSLNQNYPNPFNPATTIKYSVAEESFVELKVFNTIGKEITTLVSESKPAGNFSVSFNGEGLTSGIYFLKMSAGNFNQVLKMTLIK